MAVEGQSAFICTLSLLLFLLPLAWQDDCNFFPEKREQRSVSYLLNEGEVEDGIVQLWAVVSHAGVECTPFVLQHFYLAADVGRVVVLVLNHQLRSADEVFDLLLYQLQTK